MVFGSGQINIIETSTIDYGVTFLYALWGSKERNHVDSELAEVKVELTGEMQAGGVTVSDITQLDLPGGNNPSSCP